MLSRRHRNGGPPAQDRKRRARAAVGIFLLSLAVGVTLLLAFEPEVQTVGPGELVERRAAARAFLLADFLFVALYAAVSSVAYWRFGAALSAGRPPPWVIAAAVLLAGAGCFDAAENVLLLSATDSASPDTVDVAHALALPKIALFVGGTLLAILLQVRAVRVLTGR